MMTAFDSFYYSHRSLELQIEAPINRHRYHSLRATILYLNSPMLQLGGMTCNIEVS
ncbi:hypothetical protein COCSUDRAFT_33563, partial [Coccomyxa subellipsoidea C-169]